MERFIIADALAGLREIESESIQTIITSPPYWGLRDYGEPGQIGLEKTPDEYVEKLVAVFREARRTLREDGTLWLNLGDCYATGAGKVGDHPGGGQRGERWKEGWKGRLRRDDHKGRGNAGLARPGQAVGPRTQPNRMPIPGLKPKDLVGVPWLVAFALRADGWFLRSEIIWSKPNPMPESITDRPTKSHETVFLLSRSRRYYYDAEAIRESDKGTEHPRKVLENPDRSGGILPPHTGLRLPDGRNGLGRNRRSVWEIQLEPYSGAHYATFPEDLVKPCILAGSKWGDTVLDPFFGSGTTAAVARARGRSFVGIDINPQNRELAERRLAGVTLPIPFDEEVSE